MSKIFWKSLLISPAFLGASLLFGTAVMAAESQATASGEPSTTAQSPAQIAVTPQETKVAQAVTPATPSNSQSTLDQIIRYSNEGSANRNSLGQVTSVSQLTDVDPNSWAFQALQSLVERYGCIEGYPDRTYRGNRALTRYEFAAGLNACLNRISELIAAATADLPSKEDLAAIQRLQEEFAAELATLRGRVDALEARTAFLEAHQFSTTTKLKGEAIFALTDAFGGASRNGQDDDNQTVFQDRVRLDFQTSFNGRDVLHTRIAAGNAQLFNLPNNNNGIARSSQTFEGTQQFSVGGDTGNDIVLDWLAYEFPLWGASRGYVAAAGGVWSDFVPTQNPYFQDFDGGNGALSAFAQENPIYRIGGGAGGGFTFAFSGGGILGRTSISLGYLAGPGANNPNDDFGFFNGDYAALGQININISDAFGLGLTYVHSYNNQGSALFDQGGSNRSSLSGGITGTSLANLPGQLFPGGNDQPVVGNSYGVQGTWRVSKYFTLTGFGSYTNAIVLGRGDAEIWTWGGGIALPNLGKDGNVLGLFAGAEPYLGGVSSGGDHNFSNKNPWHVEGYYKIQVTDNISVTPGVIWLLSPNQDDKNDDIFIPTIRTTFSF